MTPGLPENIQVISFDVGFTLIYTDPPVGNVYAAIAARFGYSLDPSEVHRQFLETWKRKNALNRAKTTGNPQADEKLAYQWWKEIFLSSIGDILTPNDREMVFKVCYDEYAKGDYWRIYPEVLNTLIHLRESGYRLVILSNWDRRLHQTLWDLQLNRFFGKIYISTEIGHAKPDPGAFQYILDDLEIPAKDLLHVGDSPEEDIAGALKAGVHGILLDREGQYGYGGGDSQFPVISDLSQLL